MGVRHRYRYICHSTVAGALVTMAGNPSRRAPRMGAAGPTGARGGRLSPTAGVIRGPATMVAADSDSDRGPIAAFQCPLAAPAAAAAATGGPFRLRERAAHRAATLQRALSRPQRQAAREP